MLVVVSVLILLLSAAEGAGDSTYCTAPPAVKGTKVTMTFRFRDEVNLTQGKFYAYVRRENSLDVVNCQRAVTEAEIECTVPDSRHYQTDGIVNRALTVHILNVDHRDGGTYELIAFVDDERQDSVYCPLVVTNTTAVTDVTRDNGGKSAVSFNLIVVILCMLLLMAVVGSLFAIKHRDSILSALQSCVGKDSSPQSQPLQLETTSVPIETIPQTQASRVGCVESAPLLDPHRIPGPPDSAEYRRWFFKDFDTRDEDDLLKFSRNGNGSFLIRQGVTDDSAFTLAVCCDGVLKHFPIKKEDNVFKFRDAGTSFASLDALVTHYRDNDVIIGHTNCGKLQKPFELRPEHNWYVDDVTSREEEGKLLRRDTFEPGDFLIRQSISVPDDFTLTEYHDGVVNHLRILPDDCGYCLRDAKPDAIFLTLAELVDHYTRHHIHMEGRDYGTLVRPFRRDADNEEKLVD